MERTAKIIKSAPDGKRFIAVDKENAGEIVHFTRIYCQEVKQGNKTLIIVASELLPKKKNQKNKEKEKNIIEKVAGYEYQIEDE